MNTEQENPAILFLFDEVAVYRVEDIDSLIDNLTDEQAKYMTIKALQMAYKRGVFTLTESEIISKSLRILK